MTREELEEWRRKVRAELRQFDRSKRLRRIRQGRASPRTMAEMREFAKYLLGDQKAGQEGAPGDLE